MKVSRHMPHTSWLKTPMNSGRYRTWLLEGDSLTRRLQQSSASFSVAPLPSSGLMLADEARLLGLQSRQKALVREVFLCCNGKPAVFAHSVLPYRSLQGVWHGLGHLGSKPLGAALFSDPRVERTPLEFRKLAENHPLYKVTRRHLRLSCGELWARRSMFFLGASSILVTEIFLPQVLTL